VQVLENMPEHYSVIADAFGKKLVEVLSPNVEIQHVSGMLRGTG
jgi:hypothetical protein